MGLLLVLELLESLWWFVTDEEGSASVGVVVCCDGDGKGGETSITFSTSDEGDGLLPEMKVTIKNTN